MVSQKSGIAKKVRVYFGIGLFLSVGFVGQIFNSRHSAARREPRPNGDFRSLERFRVGQLHGVSDSV